MAATGSRWFVRGRIGRAAETALGIVPVIVVATARPRVIGRAEIEAIARAPRIAPKVVAIGLRPPIAAATPRAVAVVAAPP